MRMLAVWFQQVPAAVANALAAVSLTGSGLEAQTGWAATGSAHRGFGWSGQCTTPPGPVASIRHAVLIARARSPAHLELLGEVGVVHGHVAALAQVGVRLPEGLVPALQGASGRAERKTAVPGTSTAEEQQVCLPEQAGWDQARAAGNVPAGHVPPTCSTNTCGCDSAG